MRELQEADCGDWTGRPLRQLARSKAWWIVQQNPSRFRFPGGERFIQIQARVLQAVDLIHGAHPQGAVAVFSHGDPLRLLVSSLAGAHLDGFQRIAVDAGSVSTVWVGDGAPRIHQLNVVPERTVASGKMRG
jgi:broad specificity phosphatase PhoE